MDIQLIKQRFGIIGSDETLDQAIFTAAQVAPIQLSVLIIGESGTGKEVFPQIIHQFSQRKHNAYVVVNCGAIPEGTIDSELFGHEKGAFTGAISDRKGYFEEADGGTIFLDEIGELPLATQAKLLRVLEKGEFMKVGSSRVQKTDVRVVGATNVNLERAIGEGRFREDLFYRLNGVMIRIPPLRARKADIVPLFRKFSADFAAENRMPAVRLAPDAGQVLTQYTWPGNVRQLKNIAEQVTVLAHDRTVSADEMRGFIPTVGTAATLPAPVGGRTHDEAFSSEREILYKVLFDMRRDMTDLKKLVMQLMHSTADASALDSMGTSQLIKRLYRDAGVDEALATPVDAADAHDLSLVGKHQILNVQARPADDDDEYMPQNNPDVEDVRDERISLARFEKEAIEKALAKHGGRRRAAADELGISERTLYRKIAEYHIDDILK